MAKKNTIGSRYIKLNFHKKHIWTYVVVNVAVQFCASWQHWSKFRIWNWLSSRKHWIRIESTNNSIFLFFMWLSCQYSYFIHVMKQHYVTCPCRKIGKSYIGEKIANPRKRDNATIVLWKFGLLFSWNSKYIEL